MAASKRPPRLPSLITLVAMATTLFLFWEVPQVAAAARQKKSADAGGKDNGLTCAFMPQLKTCIDCISYQLENVVRHLVPNKDFSHSMRARRTRRLPWPWLGQRRPQELAQVGHSGRRRGRLLREVPRDEGLHGLPRDGGEEGRRLI